MLASFLGEFLSGIYRNHVPLSTLVPLVRILIFTSFSLLNHPLKILPRKISMPFFYSEYMLVALFELNLDSNQKI